MGTETNVPLQTSEKKEVATSPREQLLTHLDEFDQWFDDIRRNWMSPLLFGRGWPEAGSVLGGRMPRVDVIERDNEFCVRAELPGVNKEDLDVSLNENILAIRASTRKEEQEEKGQYFRRETSRGEFQRMVRLPGAVEGDQTKASFKDGILELIVPKAPDFKRRSIKVE